jgi:hypothetical protein
MNNKKIVATSILYIIALVGVLPAVIYGAKQLLGEDVTSISQFVHLTLAPIVFALLFVVAVFLCLMIADVKKIILLLPLLCMAILPVLMNKDADNMPSGAVVAFNRTEGCPKNWQVFLPAIGRTVLGAELLDDESIANENKVADGNGLSRRKLLEVGGTETHKLTIAEMPKHNHSNGAYRNLLRITGSGTYSGRYDETRNEPNLFSAAALKEMGENRPHNNMPPFVALYYCQKI